VIVHVRKRYTSSSDFMPPNIPQCKAGSVVGLMFNQECNDQIRCDQQRSSGGRDRSNDHFLWGRVSGTLRRSASDTCQRGKWSR
jgi:hypothetical protein